MTSTRGRAPGRRARILSAFASIAASLVGLGCGAADAPPPPGPVADARPNIVLLMAEDLGPRIGAYGDPVAHTPRVDQLAREGARFTRAFTTAGVCAPSRAAIITGVHQNRWGAGHMRAARGGYAASPPPEVKAFPELLRAAGYYTVNDGKTDYQMSLRLGGVFGGPETIWDDAGSGDWADRAPGQPFFAYLNLGQTHESQVWPTWAWPSGWIAAAMWPLRIWNHAGWPLETDPGVVALPPYYPDTPTVRADLARHYNNIAAMDVAVGRVLDRLDREGIADRTIVIFMGDHGDGLPRAKRWLYDSGLHVPLVVRWPGVVAPGGVRDALVSGVDLGPTLLSMAGVPRPDWLEGRVFIGPERGEPRRYVYAARDRMDESPDTVRAVRDERFKYIRHWVPERPYVLDLAFRDQTPMMREMRTLHAAGELSGPPALWFRARRDAEELFDTARDPHEIENLVDDPDHAETLARLRSALDAWLERGPDLGLLPEDELRRRFAPDGEQPETPEPEIRVADGRANVTAAAEGASLEVRRAGGRWNLYTAPVAVASGETLEARAQRYGWRISPTVEATAPP